MSKALIITGATGNQGGALIQALIENNADFEIIAVSRNPSSASAQRLASKSSKIKFITGDMEKPDEIFASVRQVTKAPIWGVYSVQSVAGINLFDEPEVRQGKAMVDAAIKNNVKSFVYSSVDRGGDASFNNPTNVPHFKTKHEIEHYLVSKAKDTDMVYTILRPVAFMSNLQLGFLTRAFVTMWDMVLGKESMQFVAPSDIGFFGAQAFLNPTMYQNRGISLAGDQLTFDQFVRLYKEKTGEEFQPTYRFIARLLLLMSRDVSLMLKWLRDVGYGVNIAELRSTYPGLKTTADWFTQESTFKGKRSN